MQELSSVIFNSLSDGLFLARSLLSRGSVIYSYASTKSFPFKIYTSSCIGEIGREKVADFLTGEDVMRSLRHLFSTLKGLTRFFLSYYHMNQV